MEVNQLKPKTEQALVDWLIMDGCFTRYPLDMNRFYDFVNQYQKDHGFLINERELHEVISSKLKNLGKSLDKDYEQKNIQHHIGLASSILDFLEHTGQYN